MRIVAVTDPLTAGFRRRAVLGVRVEGDAEPVADALAALPECERVALTAGSFDLMAEVVCEDDDHLLEVVNKRVRALDGVRSTESFVCLGLRQRARARGPGSREDGPGRPGGPEYGAYAERPGCARAGASGPAVPAAAPSPEVR